MQSINILPSLSIWRKAEIPISCKRVYQGIFPEVLSWSNTFSDFRTTKSFRWKLNNRWQGEFFRSPPEFVASSMSRVFWLDLWCHPTQRVLSKPSFKTCPTSRALDARESAVFSSISLASGFFCSQAESTPASSPKSPLGDASRTQTVRQYIKS